MDKEILLNEFDDFNNKEKVVEPFTDNYYKLKTWLGNQSTEPIFGEWIDVKNRLPEDFNKYDETQSYLVYIDNPFFDNGNYWVARSERYSIGSKYQYIWRGIEPNVHRPDNPPNVIKWMPLPKP